MQAAVADLLGGRGALHARDRSARQALAATALELGQEQAPELLPFAGEQRGIAETALVQLALRDAIQDAVAIFGARTLALATHSRHQYRQCQTAEAQPYRRWTIARASRSGHRVNLTRIGGD